MDKFLAHMSIRAAEETDKDGNEVRRIRGVASTGSLDRQGTFVDPKSLAKVVKLAQRRALKLFWNHSWAIPIGVRERLEMVDDRLIIEGRIGRGFPVPVAVGMLGMPVLMQVDDLWNIIKQDLTTSLSIAFNADEEKGELDEKTGKRGPSKLSVTDIFEVSLVTIPANPDCEFAVTRALDDQYFSAMHAREHQQISRTDLWGIRLDGSAAAAAVGLEGDALEETGPDPLDLLDETGHESWARVKEEVEKCRQSLRTKS